MDHEPVPRIRRVGASLCVLALAGACGTGSPSGRPTATVSATRSDVPQGSAERTLGEQDNGTTVTVRRATTLTLVLHSTYWTIDGSSDRGVLSPAQVQQDHPDPPGTCLPGVGCGTVSEQFDALRAGRAELTASRTTCGESMACQPNAASYHVTVRITG